MNTKLYNTIVKHLTAKGSYDDVDEYVILTLLENIEFANLMKEDIKANGLIIETSNGNGFITHKENPAFGTYKKCLENINQCSSKLGINRKDRMTLKLIEVKALDEFDEISTR
jgi:P27 family predicted phage terminase small subunit